MPFLGLATSADLTALQNKFSARAGERGASQSRIDSLDEEIDSRLENLNQKLESRVGGLDEELDSIRDDAAQTLRSVERVTAGVAEAILAIDNVKKTVDDAHLGNCTKLVRGIHVCDTPIYDSVILPKEMKARDVLNPTADFCMQAKSLRDLRHGRDMDDFRHLGDLDVPDNYLCVGKDSLKQYVNAFLPTEQYNWVMATQADRPFTELKPGLCDRSCTRACSVIDAPQQPIRHADKSELNASAPVASATISITPATNLELSLGIKKSQALCGACPSSLNCHPYS
jgi:hypothetical protein